MNYKDEAHEIIESARYESLTILVWGPGDPGPNASQDKIKSYNKRLKIKQTLRQKFTRSGVYFSEDPEMIEITRSISGLLRQEALQAFVSDLVLMLDISRGADLELDHFVPTYPWFRDKVFVFLPEKYVPPKGLVKEVFDYIKVEQVVGFTDQEFDRCILATEKSVNIATTIALEKWLRRR